MSTVLSLEAALDRLVPSLTSTGSARIHPKKDTMVAWPELGLARKAKLAVPIAGAGLPVPKAELEGLLVDLGRLRNRAAHGHRVAHEKNGEPTTIPMARRLVRAWQLGAEFWRLVDDQNAVWEAYRHTQCRIRVGDEWKTPRESGLAQPFWMISAQNPKEELLPNSANDRRHDALMGSLQGCHPKEARGEAAGKEGWSERMVAVTGIGRDEAVQLSRRYGQRSVFEFQNGKLHPPAVTTGDLLCERPLA